MEQNIVEIIEKKIGKNNVKYSYNQKQDDTSYIEITL